jgi:hypothetical protein
MFWHDGVWSLPLKYKTQRNSDIVTEILHFLLKFALPSEQFGNRKFHQSACIKLSELP